MSEQDPNRPAQQDSELSSSELEQVAGGVTPLGTALDVFPPPPQPIKTITTSPLPSPGPVTTGTTIL